MAAELLRSEKDKAEHIMIVDLERNDLGRVAEVGTVKVSHLYALEEHPTVWHLVSTVEAKIPADKDVVDLLFAMFPGGSITGAPKIRAMEIIDEVEPVARGIYTGSIGYWSWTGHCDFNIVIRTAILSGGMAYFHAGGGIVADSDPKSEYEETLAKAKGLLKMLGCASTELRERQECAVTVGGCVSID
jgi:para-aminobenzoate synthetase component 1